MAYSIPMNEGQQAEEYLKRKKEEKENEKSEEYKYRKNSNRPSARQKDGYSNVYFSDEDKTSSIPKNPKYKTAMEIEQHRRKYGDVMPKKTKAELDMEKARDKEKKEKEYAFEVVKQNAKKDTKYSDDDVQFKGKTTRGQTSTYRNFGKDGEKVVYNSRTEYGTDQNLNNVDRAYDAARRHYRRTHKNESFGIFESVQFLDDEDIENTDTEREFETE